MKKSGPQIVDPSRRALLGGLLAASVAGACTSTEVPPPARMSNKPAAPPARVKGPRVFLDYDQAELDAAYDQSVYAPNLQQIVGRYATNSERTRQRIGLPSRVAYGPTGIERIDIYRTKRANAPIQIFIHGGAWRGGLAKDSAYPADTFVDSGAHYLVPDFVWVQNAGGSLLPMADQVRRAVMWAYRNAASFGGDPNRIFVSGHSSGGHLAGCIVTTDWQKQYGVPANIVKGAVLISGMYDLRGPRLSARSAYVKFTDEMEQLLSPQRHLPLINAPLVIGYGSLETPEFIRQSREFAQAVRGTNKPVELIVGEGYNHFEIAETLGNPHGHLGRAALAQMGIA